MRPFFSVYYIFCYFNFDAYVRAIWIVVNCSTMDWSEVSFFCYIKFFLSIFSYFNGILLNGWSIRYLYENLKHSNFQSSQFPLIIKFELDFSLVTAIFFFISLRKLCITYFSKNTIIYFILNVYSPGILCFRHNLPWPFFSNRMLNSYISFIHCSTVANITLGMKSISPSFLSEFQHKFWLWVCSYILHFVNKL